MTDPVSFRMLAEIDPARIARLEQDLSADGGFIAWVYVAILVAGLVLDAALLLYWRARAVPWRQRLNRLLWRPVEKRELLVLLLFLGMLQVCAGFVISSLEEVSLGWNIRTDSLILIVQTLAMHVAGLMMVALLLRENRVSWRSAFGLDARSIGKRAFQGLIFLLATMPPLFFYTFVYHLGLQSFNVDATPQDVLFAISDETSVPMRAFFVVLAGALAPAFEEILFRGMILPVLAKRYPLSIAITVVSVLFAVVHWNVASFLPLMVLSVAFCLVYIYTESLLVPIVMHGLFNMVTVSMLFYTQ